MQLVRLCLTLAGLLTAQTVEAQPYKCTVEGKIVYQQVKCPGAESVNTSGAGKADTTSQAAIQASREVAYYKRQERVNAAIAEGKIFVGMTRDEVLKSWGEPNKVNKTVTAGGITEQWIYRRGKIGDDQYVYLDNGVVRSMQSSE